MPKTNVEDTPDVADETEAVLVEAEEIIPEDIISEDEETADKPVPKKMAALKARHRLEDYFEMKRIQDELDYLDDEKKRKAALLQKVKATQDEKPVKHVVKEAKEIKAVKEAVKIEVKKVPVIEPKPKAKPKAKAKAKPKVQAKSKAKPKTKKKSKK